MAQKRIFSMQIVDTDAFLDMPPTSQLLYFHLSMRADDEGFVANPKKIMRMVGIQEDDLKILLAKRFILGFESGVVVIKHWLIHNTIRVDRFNPTTYTKEKETLKIGDNKAYTENKKPLVTKWQPNVNQMEPQVKLSKVKLSKVNKDITNVIGETPKSFGREDINLLLDDLRRGLGILDGTIREQRNFAKLFLDTKVPQIFKAMSRTSWTPEELRAGVVRIAQLAKEDGFHHKNANSLKYLYKHAGAIISGSQDNISKKIKSFTSK